MKSKLVLAAATAAGLLVCAYVSPTPLKAGDAGGQRNPVAPDAKSIAAGRELYAANCADCHGPRGKGDGKMAGDLKKRPTDLTDPAIASEGDDVLFRRISRARKPMPSFEKMLTEEQRWHVVNYLHTLSAGR